jgi:hypothetical protein
MNRLLHEPGYFDGPVATSTEAMRFGTVDAVIYQYAEKVSDLPPEHYCRQYVKDRRIPIRYWSKLYFAEHYDKFLAEIAPEHGKTIKDEPRLVIPFYDRFGAVCAVSGRALGYYGQNLQRRCQAHLWLGTGRPIQGCLHNRRPTR